MAQKHRYFQSYRLEDHYSSNEPLHAIRIVSLPGVKHRILITEQRQYLFGLYKLTLALFEKSCSYSGHSIRTMRMYNPTLFLSQEHTPKEVTIGMYRTCPLRLN